MAESAAWPLDALAAPAIFVTRKQLSLRVEELLARRRFAAPHVAIAPAVIALVASLGVVSVAAVHGPAVDVAGAPPAQQNAIARVRETNVLFVDRTGRKTIRQARARMMMVHADPRTLEDIRALDGATPEQLPALLKKLDVDRIQHDTASPRSPPPHTR